MTDERKESKPRRRKRRQENELAGPEGVGFVLNATIVTLMKEDLDIDEDQNRALRRALLALIWLVQENLVHQPSSAVALDFIQYLLFRFPPLADHFNAKHRHFFLRGEDVMRAKISEYSVGLLIRKEFGKSVLDQAAQMVKDDPDE